MSDMLDKLKAFLDSEEGEKAMEEFAAKIAKENAFKDRWVQKILTRIENEDNLDALYEALMNHDNKMSSILYDQHIDGQSDLIHLVFEAITEIGKDVDEERYEMFTSAMYEYKGYIFEMICGQGCFIKIFKDERN